MQKPSDYDSVQAFTDYNEFLPAGGYVCKILNAIDTVAKNGSPMLVLELDIVEGQYKDYFSKLFERRKKTYSNAKWSCVFRKVVNEADGETTSKYFKGLITAIEGSNKDFMFNFDEKTLIGKLVGMIFQREEYLNYSGEARWTTKPTFPRSADEIRAGNFTVPKDKALVNKPTDKSAVYEGFTLMDDDDEGLPF